jgi:hypothetical protein
MNTVNKNAKLTGQDWFWIIFVAIVASIATFGGFILFLPAYVLALLCGYFATRKFTAFFDRKRRSMFVLKVLAVALPVFVILCWVEILLMPSVYKP